MAEKLNEAEVTARLGALDGDWRRKAGGKLVREYSFEDFASALAFVNRIGELAERVNHHPDLELGWGRVGVTLTTHSVGCLTGVDFDLAADIEALYQEN